MVSPKNEPSSITVVRDRLAYLISKRASLWRSLACGAVMAWAVISVGSVPTPLSKWSLLLGAFVLGVSVLEVRAGAVFMGLICTVQMFCVYPPFGWIALLLSILFFLVSLATPGRACAVLATPYLMTLYCGIAAPLGLAAASRKRSAWFWGGAAFMWTAMHALAAGPLRIGIPALTDYRQALEALHDKKVAFSSQWLREVLRQSDLGQLKESVLEYLTKPSNGVPFLLQLLLWIGVAYLVRLLYRRRRRRYKDRLALEYLKKVTRQTEAKSVPFFRRLPTALGLGALCFVVGYIVLGIVYKNIHYGVLPAVMDVVAAALLWLPLAVVLEGDRRRGKLSKLERMAEAAESLDELHAGSRAAGRTGPRATASASGHGRTYATRAPHPRPDRSSAPSPRPRTVAAPPPTWKPPPIARPKVPTTSGVGRSKLTFAVEAVVFIDMVGSTAMGSRFGDNYVLSLKEQLAGIVEEESRRQDRLFIKGTGDGHMLTFPDAPKGVMASLAIMRRIQEINKGLEPGRRIHLRFGVHMGELNIDSHGDRIGTAVNFAARIEGTKREQLRAAEEDPEQVPFPEQDRIFISETVQELVQELPGVAFRPLGYFEFKGISGLHRIIEIKSV